MTRLLLFISLLNGLAAFAVIYAMSRPYLEAGGRTRHLAALLAVVSARLEFAGWTSRPAHADLEKS